MEKKAIGNRQEAVGKEPGARNQATAHSSRPRNGTTSLGITYIRGHAYDAARLEGGDHAES
jgi:hypothetical protein